MALFKTIKKGSIV